MKFNRHRYQNDTPGDTGTSPCANAVNKTWPLMGYALKEKLST